MKKVTLLLLAAMLVSVFDAQAEDDKKRRKRRRGGPTYEIGINPIGYAIGIYNIIGAAHLSDQTSLFIEVAYRRNTFPTAGFDSTGMPVMNDIIYNGFSIAPEFRYYLSPDNGNDRWFVGGYLNFRQSATSGKPYLGVNVEEDLVRYDVSNIGIAPGVTFGYHLLTNSGLTFTFWAGGGYSVIYSSKNTPDFTPSNDPAYANYNNLINAFNRVDFRGGLTIGYRF